MGFLQIQSHFTILWNYLRRVPTIKSSEMRNDGSYEGKSLIGFVAKWEIGHIFNIKVYSLKIPSRDTPSSSLVLKQHE